MFMDKIAMNKIIAVGQIVDMASDVYKESFSQKLTRAQRRQFSKTLEKLRLSSLFFQAGFGCVSLKNNRPLDGFIPKSIADKFKDGEAVRVELVESKNGPRGEGFLVKQKLDL